MTPKYNSQMRIELERRCKDAGFTRIRFTSVDSAPGIGEYDRFLSKGFHGDMSWMVRSRPPRSNPKELMTDAKTIMVLGIDYWHPRPPKPSNLHGRVSRYAWGRDYHNLIGKRLHRMCKEWRSAYPGLKTYFGVDSRPFIERAWAEKSGLGFIGKNSMVISSGESSYFFLAMVMLNVALPSDAPILKDHCGRCTRCLTDCPTDAFIGAFQLDARRCISYWTIEKNGLIPQSSMAKMGDWFFGCDDCQEVCPHNHHPKVSFEKDLAPRPNNAWVDLEWLLTASDEVILNHFEGSPLRRAGPLKLRRNALVVLGNSGDPSALPIIKSYLDSNHQTLVTHARWSLARCIDLIRMR